MLKDKVLALVNAARAHARRCGRDVRRGARRRILDFYENNANGNSPLSTWPLAHFGTNQSVGNAADGADPDHDGKCNLLEYAYGSAPSQADVAIGLALDFSHDGFRLRLSFNRVGDPALRYSVLGADSLSPGDWTEIWWSTGADNEYGPVTVEDVVPVSETAQRFLKLEVTSP